MKTWIIDENDASPEPTITPAADAVKPVRGDLSEGEHTPGPWVAVLNEAQDHRADVVTDCLCVATCGTGNLALANARLIARAPELLADNRRLREALGSLLDGMEQMPQLNEAIVAEFILGKHTLECEIGGDEANISNWVAIARMALAESEVAP